MIDAQNNKNTDLYLSSLMQMRTLPVAMESEPMQVLSHKQSKWYNINRFPTQAPLHYFLPSKKQKLKNELNNKEPQFGFPKNFNLGEMKTKIEIATKYRNHLLSRNYIKIFNTTCKSEKKTKVIESIAELNVERQPIRFQTEKVRSMTTGERKNLQTRLTKKKQQETIFHVRTRTFSRSMEIFHERDKGVLQNKCQKGVKIVFKKPNNQICTETISKDYSTHIKYKVKHKPSVSLSIKQQN